MHGDIVLPAFEMDCRDWLVATPEEAGLPDDVEGAPLLAVLSTAVVDTRDLRSVSATITVGLLDDDAPAAVAAAPGCPAAEIVENAPTADDEVSIRYIVPAPTGGLALLAEFTVCGDHVAPGDLPEPELARRIEALMSSFRWAVA